MSAGEVVEERHEPTVTEMFLSQMVTLKAGNFGKKYQVHKALLMRHSEYFHDKLLSGDCNEVKIGEDILQCQCNVAVEALIDWMYSKKFPDKEHDWYKYGDMEYLTLKHVLDLNALAHFLIIPELKRPALKLVVDILNSCSDHRYCFSDFAFGVLPKDHPVLQLVIDYHCRSYTSEDFGYLKEFLDDSPAWVMDRVLEKYSEMVGRAAPLKLSDYLKD